MVMITINKEAKGHRWYYYSTIQVKLKNKDEKKNCTNLKSSNKQATKSF